MAAGDAKTVDKDTVFTLGVNKNKTFDVLWQDNENFCWWVYCQVRVEKTYANKPMAMLSASLMKRKGNVSDSEEDDDDY